MRNFTGPSESLGNSDKAGTFANGTSSPLPQPVDGTDTTANARTSDGILNVEVMLSSSDFHSRLLADLDPTCRFRSIKRGTIVQEFHQGLTRVRLT
jgi:hypothetical protein